MARQIDATHAWLEQVCPGRESVPRSPLPQVTYQMANAKNKAESDKILSGPIALLKAHRSAFLRDTNWHLSFLFIVAQNAWNSALAKRLRFLVGRLTSDQVSESESREYTVRWSLCDRASTCLVRYFLGQSIRYSWWLGRNYD